MKNITLPLSMLLGMLMISACNNESGSGSSHGNSGSDSDSKVSYLKKEHDAYKDGNTIQQAPAAMSLNGDELYWDIYAEDEEHALTLKEHIEFMGAHIEAGEYPRSWDPFFILEAEMHPYIHTAVQVNGRQVTIHKSADNACAYSIMTAHAQVLSGEFFALGDTSQSHAVEADAILASAECAEFAAELQAAIDTQLTEK